MPSGIVTLIIVTGSMLALFVIITTVGNNYSLNQIKNKTVGQRSARNCSLGDQKGNQENLQAN